MQKLKVQTDILSLLKEHIKLSSYIPLEFRRAFYKDTGRPRGVSIESFLWFCILQSIIGIKNDGVLLLLVKICRELREFCGFESVPDADKFTLFRQNFTEYIVMVFNNFVDATEPICHALDPKKSGYLLYDTSGIEANVKENNPKFINSKISQAKKIAAKNPEINAHALPYSQLPDVSQTNPFVNQQFINGHFCYAHKFALLTNGLGIIRHISFFDEDFKRRHHETVSHKTDNPDIDKEVSDSASLKPVLLDFFASHPHFWRTYHTFLSDSAFDVYDNYSMLRNDFHFKRTCIPLNPRNSKSAHADFDDNGTPVCPIDKTPFIFLGISGGKNRSKRLKFVCHKSVKIKGATKRRCTCDNPCTDKPYGRCVYTYPHKNLRLYPGITRGTEHWNNLYRHRTLIERTIWLLKVPLGGAIRKSFSARTAKADIFIAGITHLIGVIIAVASDNSKLFKSVRRLISA
jgi:hypothetical protein